MMTVDQMQRALLLAMAIGLTPIALAYGAAPQASLPWLYRIDVSDVPTRHIFRAIMGLYLAMICLWAAGALRPAIRLPALWSLFVFTLGIGLGRALSLLLDGWPGPLLALYLPAELALAASSGWLISRNEDRHAGA
ncbi:MAG: DUF4345 domain-containing protein [Pseudomonadota bacterium]